MSGIRSQTKNPLRARLESGEVLFGAMLNTPTPQLVEICGLVGFDWVFVDGQHDYVDARLAYDLSTAADAVGVPLVVRAPTNRSDVLLSYAEAGAHAVVAPEISTAEDAERLVTALSYPPRGHRGLHSRTRSSRYGIGVDPPAYFEDTDAHAMPVAMVENVDAVSNLGRIAAVPDLDLFLVGPGDLSGSLGLPGRIHEPAVVDTVHDAVQTLVGAGKTVAILASTPALSAHYVRRGVRMPMCSTGALVVNAMQGFLSETQDRIFAQQQADAEQGVRA